MEQLRLFADTYLSTLHIPKVETIQYSDILEILILSFLIYHILIWIKNTKAWNLLKGLVVILVFILIAAIMEMNTIIWIVQNVFSIAVIAIIIVLQPELRRALEELGKKNIMNGLLPIDVKSSEGGLFSDKTIQEISKACVEMSRVRTGALIVVAQNESLADYESTGIAVDGLVSSQLLINIFEKNTPLHDGAVIIRGDRVTSATCYLPLSENTGLSKALGTRHRAGIGISEATDSVTLIVSEENGMISAAYQGELKRGLNQEGIEEVLSKIQNKTTEDRKLRLWKGRAKNEKKADS
ncbi:MAG: diadenylate cyclase CdaA [Lachnospiraceae bacterium]|nr:diadenylate cyclase CdaA [Lachnospiraceae bacterium]